MGVPLPSTGHRERKKQRTRERLIESAMKLFGERGYENTRIEDIVADVDVVPRTFFRYFAGKDDALFGWMEEVRAEILLTLRARPKGEGVVRALVTAHQAFVKAHHVNQPIVHVIHQLADCSPDIGKRFAAFTRRTQDELAEELSRKLPASANLVAIVMTAAVHSAFRLSVDQWVEANRPRPLADYWTPTSAKLLRLFEEIDREYVLR